MGCRKQGKWNQEGVLLGYSNARLVNSFSSGSPNERKLKYFTFWYSKKFQRVEMKIFSGSFNIFFLRAYFQNNYFLSDQRFYNRTVIGAYVIEKIHSVCIVNSNPVVVVVKDKPEFGFTCQWVSDLNNKSDAHVAINIHRKSTLVTTLGRLN